MKIHYLITEMLQTLVWIPTRIVLKALTHLKILGKENLEDIDGPVIFASNHQSEMDVIMLPATLTPFTKPFPMFYVARPKGKYIETGSIKSKIYGGPLFQWWGAYPIISGLKNYGISLKVHKRISEKGKSIHIFPEGRLSKTGDIAKEARGGLGYLAYAAGATVVPVAIHGTRQTSIKDFLLGRKHYTVQYGKPLTPKELMNGNSDNPSVEDFKYASQAVLTKIKNMYKELDKGMEVSGLPARKPVTAVQEV